MKYIAFMCRTIKMLISNWPYQTHCPQKRTFALQWSLHGVYATGRAQRYYVSLSQINIRKSCLPRRFVEEFCQLCEQKMEKVEQKRKTDRHLYVVEVVEVDTTRKQLKNRFVGFSHEYDEWRDYDNKRNYFPFVRLEKMFFPEEGSLEDRGNIHGQLYRCLIPSISSQLCVQEQILWSLLRPLKCYKLKSCGNK